MEFVHKTIYSDMRILFLYNIGHIFKTIIVGIYLAFFGKVSKSLIIAVVDDQLRPKLFGLSHQGESQCNICSGGQVWEVDCKQPCLQEDSFYTLCGTTFDIHGRSLYFFIIGIYLSTHDSRIKHFGGILYHLVDVEAVTGIKAINIGIHRHLWRFQSPADLAHHTADGIIDEAFKHFLPSFLQCVGICVKLSSIPTSIVL